MRILTNLALAPRWRASSGLEGETVSAHTLRDFLAQVRRSDLVLVDCNLRLLLRLAALFRLRPWMRRPLVGSDVVLCKPHSARGWLANPLHRLLLARVDHFLWPFRDLTGCQKYFGIRPQRSSFYRFKPNLRDHCDLAPDPEGEYVLLLGRSRRDFDSFFDAMAITGLPGAVAEPDFADLRANGSRFSRRLSEIPPNVRRVPQVFDDHQSLAGILSGAKVVVIPLLKSNLVSTVTPYSAMLLGKCTLVTEGPATRGLFHDEVLTIPAEDPAGIARVITRAWDDRELRERTAAKGYALATSLGGTPELLQRLLDLTVDWWMSWSRHSHHRYD